MKAAEEKSTTLEEQYNTEHEKAEKLASDIQAKSEEISSVSAQLEDQKKKLQIAEENFASSSGEIEQKLQEQIRVLCDEKESSEKESAELKSEIEKLNGSILASKNEIEKLRHIQKTDKDEQSEIINELTSNLEKYVSENEELQEQVLKLNEVQEQSKIASELLLQSGNEETNKLISERDNLSKLNDEKDLTIQQVNDDLEKLRTELTEKIAAETFGREAAVKAKEKIEGKYEDLKKKFQEKLAEQSTGSEALQSQIDGLKKLSNNMEEEIENNKIQKMKDDKKLEEIERELLEKESKCLQLEETHDEEIDHMKGKLKKLQKDLEETTQLQVEKMTLEIRLQEMEEKMRSGGMEIATPKTDPSAVDAQSSQISFLNSIVSDQQNEISKLKDKNYELEQMLVDDGPTDNTIGQNSTAYFDTTAASFGGSKTASKPVRLYCDICEEFDKHDTDDCPLQEGGGSNYGVKNDKWDPNSYDDDDETY